jgi:cytochrome c oxidase assembly factor CtaG
MHSNSKALVRSFFTSYYFLGAALSAIAVISPPLGTHVQTSFTAHMIQHITLMMITGPLFVLATPSTWHPTNKLFALFTHPILSWVLYATLMIGVHLPGPHDYIMMNSWAHDFIEVPLYLLIPYLFYFNLLDRNLTNRRISPALSVISLFLMMVPETLTGFFIYVSNESLYQGMYPIDDQRRGGSFMWSGAMFIDVIWMSFAVYHWIKSEERKSIEVDAEIARDAKAAKNAR